MLPIKYELLFFIIMASIGSYILRDVFFSELPKQISISNFMEAQDLALSDDSDFQTFNIQDSSLMAPGNFEGDDFVYFSTNSIGQKIIYELNGVEAGIYTLKIYLVPGRDFGIINVKVNGLLINDGVDLYSPILAKLEPLIVENLELETGDLLTFEVVGKNQESAMPYFQVGIDGIVVDKID